MKSAFALAAILVATQVAHAKGTPKKTAKADKADKADDDADDKPDKPDKKDADADADAAEPDPDADPDADTDKPAKKGDQQDKDVAKQDLNGHDLGTKKKENEFEKDRFYVDKIDNEKTEKGTLVQGSIASSSFFYTESGGNYMGGTTGSDAAKFSRYFTDLRLQTDFRHISAGRWDARVDTRLRVVNTPTGNDPLSADATHVQSGFQGRNEYEIRELWVIRNGVRSDVLFGRQFIPDLGAIKIDGLRIDYAKSKRFTLLGFAGLYPIRGSRSITTDYQPLRDDAGKPAGRVVGAGGFGAAYRTLDSYGSIGGVALVPTAAEAPRVYATSSGYLRAGPTLDFYHFAIVDLIAQSGAALTNLSAGLNFKPNQRLRLTANVNRVDTDTLNVQARAFLDPADPTGAGANTIQNETFIKRLATNSARAGISAGLGPLQRFELSTALTVRDRPAVALSAPVIMGGPAPATVTLAAAKGVDLYAAITDRHSVKDARIGLDVSRTFGIGAVPYQRTEVLAARVFVAHDIKDGRGEWEAEISYATTKDVNAGTTCTAGTLDTCFGSTTNSIISAGGNLYYRLTRDWFGLASLNVANQATKTLIGGAVTTDPAILGLTGFGRIAYRF